MRLLLILSIPGLIIDLAALAWFLILLKDLNTAPNDYVYVENTHQLQRDLISRILAFILFIGMEIYCLIHLPYILVIL